MSEWAAIGPAPQDVSERLAALGLTIDDLLEPIRAGVAGRRAVTLHHPRAYGGWRDYAERIAALRDTLTPRGWYSQEDEGLCLTVHPEGLLAIWTALGDSGTGSSRPVSTRRKRGKVTEQLVRNNAAQLEFALGLETEKTTTPEPKIPTWVLLVFIDQDEVHSELSLARHIDDGFIDRWADRIPLPVIRLNDILEQIDDDELPPPDVDVDVEEL